MLTRDRPPRAELRPGESWSDWAQSLEDHGRRILRARTSEEQRSWRQAGYIAAIVVNAILLAVAHSLLGWHVPFITPGWADVLFAIDLSLGGTIVANALYVSYDERWFRDLIKIALTVLSFVACLVVVQVFPFDFGDPLMNWLTHLAGILVVFALAIAMIIQTIVWIVEQIRRGGTLGPI
jgi:hypothetical protein